MAHPILGALNHQTAHHLFPGVLQYYYPQITPIIQAACKEFNVPYHYKSSFTEVREASGCCVSLTRGRR